MKKFNGKLAKELFSQIKKGKSEGKGLIDVFTEFSVKNDMAMGSVRNFYYKTIKKSKTDNKLKKCLNITDEMFPEFVKEFTQSEEKELLKGILLLVSKGKSVRKSICELSGGSEKLTLRNLNKYRNVIKNKPEMVREVVCEIEMENGYCKNPYEIKTQSNLKEKLENSVNNLIDKLYGQIIKENDILKEKIDELNKENASLKKILKQNMLDKSFTKDFFLNNHENANNERKA